MFNEELIAAKVAARNAGKILNKHFKSHSKDIQYKKESGNSPVTAADYEADKYLASFLGGEFPHDGWLSEETVDTIDRLDKKRTWIVDPLDGTKEFIQKLPEFCVSIALVEDSIPVIGVIYNPISDEMFYAQKNKGAFLNGNQIQISTVEHIKDASIIVSRSEKTKGLWNSYKNNFSSIKSCGSIAYKLGLAASGIYDITATVAPKNEWDICAGDCIISEAGGVMKKIDGKNIIYNQKKTLVTDPIIATNSMLFDNISDLLY
ncbi:MAG: 3'(2'),5'-bisphosphate nucleotidase CysQ [Candidatus Neomarinimicrobiota bacterium]|nr:3'(2'),5'-bisphosphate nucleotidase CysQ [Candidatus Neomarinimicrobiota bacterium]